MKIKRYIASNSQEAMMKIRSELGTEAVILHTRKIKKQGFTGFFQKPLVEVVAAIDKEEKNTYTNRGKPLDDSKKKEALVENNKMDKLQDQLNSIQDLILDVINKDNKAKDSNSKLIDEYFKMLEENDIDKNIINKILNIAQKQIKFTPENKDAIKKAIRIIIKEYLGPPSPVNVNEDSTKIILFVGPTGVGKTTTLAKLAAQFSIKDNKSVGLITADTYRIAAVEQLRTYSEILDIPLKVIYAPEEIKEKIDELGDREVILIDTAGRNHKVEEQLLETKDIIKKLSNPEVFLVISATTTYKDIKSIIQSYSFIEDFKLIFTKLDESTTVGNILNTKIITGKSLSYFTTGQTVPDDLEIASPEKIVSLIVGE